MNETTPFAALLSKKSNIPPFQFQLATWERWLGAAALMAVSCMAVGGTMALKLSSHSWSAFTLIAGVVAFGACAVHQVTTLALEARKMRDPSRVILTRLDQRFELEHEMIEDLARAHSL